MGKGKMRRKGECIIIKFEYVTVFAGLFLLSTKIVDNLWRTMFTIFKSDIFARVLSEMPFFYTIQFTRNYGMLQPCSVKIGGCAVKPFR